MLGRAWIRPNSFTPFVGCAAAYAVVGTRVLNSFYFICDYKKILSYFAVARDFEVFAISKSACRCVSLSVCQLASLINHTSKFYQIFCIYSWPWLGPPLIAVQYVIYFRFCQWRCFQIMDQIGQNQSQRRRVRIIQFTRWRHRGRSLLSPTTCCSQMSENGWRSSYLFSFECTRQTWRIGLSCDVYTSQPNWLKSTYVSAHEYFRSYSIRSKDFWKSFSGYIILSVS